ncbi:unnamed protein product [Knipowitschia caucasica]
MEPDFLLWREEDRGACPHMRVYYCDRHSHNQRKTTFIHPGNTSENSSFIVQLPESRVMSSVCDTSTNNNNKVQSKRHSFGKRHLSVRRNLSIRVEQRGWLHKQDSSALRMWKRKWFVLSDFCLFYYRDSRELSVLGSIPLLSYEVCPVEKHDHINRKNAFKAEHAGMRTYFFSAETQEDMNSWIKVMNQSSLVQSRDQGQVQTQVQNPDQDRIQIQVQTRAQSLEQDRVQTQLQSPDQDRVQTQVQTRVENTVLKGQNGIHCGTNTSTDSHSLYDLSLLRSSEEQVSLGPELNITTQQATPPEETGSTYSQNRFSPILEPNGIAAGTYQITPPPSTPLGSLHKQATPIGRQATPTGKQATPTRRQSTPTRKQALPTGRQATPTGTQATPPNNSLSRSSVRETVQSWVQVQRDETRGRTPTAQFSHIEPPQLNAPSEYRYSQHRLSHLGLTDGETLDPLWRLCEWQQRHRYRHGNPTAPLYSPVPLHPYGPRPLATTDQSRAPTPRCIEVPPTAAEVLPSLMSQPISRRPHIPAERRTVRPTNHRGAPGRAAPRRSQSQFFKTLTLDRRSAPVSSYMKHTVSAPSLSGRNVDDSYLQLKNDLEYLDLKIRSLDSLVSAVHTLLLHCTAGRPQASMGPQPSRGPQASMGPQPYRGPQPSRGPQPRAQLVGGKVQLEPRTALRVAESDIDVKLSRLCEKDKAVKDLDAKISALQLEKEELEATLALCHQQMELSLHTGSPHIAVHQKILQEELVQVRAQISRGSTDWSKTLQEFVLLQNSVEDLRRDLQDKMDKCSTESERVELQKELWRLEDVLAGLRPEQRPETSGRKSVPIAFSTDFQTSRCEASPNMPPPRPPLPSGFCDNDAVPEVPPLPRESAVIRHTSVRGLKRQSDERRRDKEDWMDLRSFLSEPDLVPLETDLTSGLGGSPSAFVTLRQGEHKERPKSAIGNPASSTDTPSSVQSHGEVCAKAPPPTPKRTSSRHRPRQLRQEMTRQGWAETHVD